LKTNGKLIQAIESRDIEKLNNNGTIDEGLVYFHSLEGEYIVGYVYKKGEVVKKIVPKKKINKAAIFSLFMFYNGCDENYASGRFCNDLLEGIEIRSTGRRTLYYFFTREYSSFEYSGGGDSTGEGNGDNDNGGGSGDRENSDDNNSTDDIIDNTNNECVSDIIKKLQEKDKFKSLVPDLTGVSHLSQTILDLFGGCKNYDLEIKIAELGRDIQGNYKNAQTNGFESITLDDDLVDEATKLSIAKTLIHESMHVFINYNINKRDTNSALYKSLEEYYIKYNNEPNLSQHNFFSQYVEALAYSLAAYDSHRQDISYYTKLSWGGLEYSDTYKDKTQSQKDEIQKIINNERFAENNAKGTKCE
jgi:hypothetical protein